MSRRAGGSEDKWFVTRVYPAYPNRTQERELLRQLDVARGVYNHFADTCIHCLIDGTHVPDPMEMNREFTLMRADDCLLRSVNSYTLREVINRVWQAVERCERRSLADGELHVPRIKTPSRFRSICFDPKSSKIENSRIRLNRDLSVRCRNLARPRNGRAVTVRAVRRGTGRWYICITYETDRVIHGEMDVGEPDRAEGYDLGLVDLITDSRGNKIRTPDFFMEAEAELAHLRRQLSRLEEGTAKWLKTRRRIARIEERIRRRRDGCLDRVADWMVSGKTTVVVEDIDVRRLASREDGTLVRRKRFTEAAWATLVGKAERKARKTDVRLIRVSPAYTTRTCSRCGHVGDGIPLSERMFRCPVCGLEMDRDRNAARNILGSGMGTQRCTAEPSG